MTNLSDLFDLELFQEMKDSGFVKAQRHPEFPNDLAIVNYTKRAQINYHWNDVTIQCRGLVYNPKTLEIVSRPFAKFFNYDEKQAPSVKDDELVVAFDKLDGSLGVMYTKPDWTVAIATRGSFSSDQAVKATEILHEKNYGTQWDMNEQKTFLFEIVYPENRIVVDYGAMEELVYLGEIMNDTGEFVYRPENFSGPSAELLYKGSLRNLFQEHQRPGQEGYVIHASEGRMAKVKYDEYVKLHRVVTRLSERTIWEMMNGPDGDIDELVSKLDEEHARWARAVAERLRGAYFTMHMHISEVAMREKAKERDRKELALAIANEPAWVKACVFMGLDGKSYKHVLWKNIRPAADKDLTDG